VLGGQRVDAVGDGGGEVHITADSPKAMPSVTPNRPGARTPVDVENLA
jgi:hypothetical protein